MPKWEFKRVPCTVLVLSEALKDPVAARLDPEIPDWPRHTLEPGGDLARVFWWDEKNCWTLRSKRLTMLGDQGWEMVAISPAHDTTAHYSEYEVYFKRIKEA